MICLMLKENPTLWTTTILVGAVIGWCRGCEWVSLCHGGCMKDRLAVGDPATSASALCAAYRKFLPHAVPFFRELNAELLRPGKGASA